MASRALVAACRLLVNRSVTGHGVYESLHGILLKHLLVCFEEALISCRLGKFHASVIRIEQV